MKQRTIIWGANSSCLIWQVYVWKEKIILHQHAHFNICTVVNWMQLFNALLVFLTDYTVGTLIDIEIS